MAEFKPEIIRFAIRGVNLNRPVDLMELGYYPVVTNLRSYIDGIIQTRPGWTSFATFTGNGHSIKRLNDSIAGTFLIIVGAGTTLVGGTTGAFAVLDTGYSGTGLTFAILSPVRSPRAWCYVGDSSKLRKVKADGTDFLWGIAPPTKAPVVQFGVPATTIVENFEDSTEWTASGQANSLADDARIATDINAIVYDSGSTGWCSIEPTDIVNFGRGAVVKIDTEDNVVVDSMHPAIAATDIAAIAYDSGSTGPCSIQLSAPTAKGWLKKFSMLDIDGEAVTVVDVVIGSDNIPSIRTSTTSTHAASDPVTGLRSIRAYTTTTRAATDAITSNAVQVQVDSGSTTDGTQVTGNGQITKTVAVDATLADDRPIDPQDDEVHLSIYVSKLRHWEDATLIFDVDATTNNGTQNYYFKTLTVNDFASTDPSEGDQTIDQARLNRLEQKLKNATQRGDFDKVLSLNEKIAAIKAQIDQVIVTPLDDQSFLGNKQWHELRFKTKEFFRVGTNLSRTLKDVAAIIISINVSSSKTGNQKSRVLRFDSCWIGGTYGPDIGDLGQPYRYIYRYRATETGATSAWSPPSRSGIEAHKQRIALTPVASSDGQVDKIDYARIGGLLQDFRIVGTGPNTTAVFNDDSLDIAALLDQGVDLDSFQPFPITDLPKTGTVDVAGTTVSQISGDTFNTSWARNSIIIIDKVPYTLYGPPLSTTRLELNENGGALTGVSYYMPAPLLTGQPLPAVWGPLGYGQTGVFIFACGDSKNAGTLFWTNGNDPDLCHDSNSLEVCSPSEPLINGCVWAGRSYVLSSERMYEIFPNFSLFPGTIQGQSQFVTQPIGGSKGLFNRYCLAVGEDGIYFLSKDGIEFSTGGAPVSITDPTLYDLFPHEGQVGTAVNGYNPVDMTKPMRLCWYDGYCYFSYVDTANAHVTLVYDSTDKGWVFDKPNPAAISGTVMYGEEGQGVHGLILGGSDEAGLGTLWRAGGVSDDGAAIQCELDTACTDLGDDRLNKLWGDYILDSDTSNLAITSTPGFNNYSTMLGGQSVQHNGRTISPPLDLNSGEGQIALNMGLKLTWSSASLVVYLYGWQPSYVVKPVNTILRFSDWSNLGVNEPKFVHGIRLHADTLNVARTLRIQGDNGTNGLATTDITLTGVQHNGESIIDYAFDPPFIAHLVRLAPNDANQWRLFDDFQFQFDLDSPLVTSYISQVTANDLQGFQHIRDGYIAHISTADISMVWIVDGVTLATITIPNGGGVFTKTYFIPPAVKWKTIQYKLTSTAGFRLYKRACELRMKQWGSASAYQIAMPFGQDHYNEGPRI